MTFQVNKTYGAMDSGLDPIRIMKRTPKCVVATTNGMNRFRMVVKTDSIGNEYVTDSSVPMKWREAYTYSAILEQK